MTAYIYINTDSNVRVFNNLLTANAGDAGPNNGWILMFDDANDQLYNNTVIGGTTSGSANCISLYSGQSFVLENNILSSCNNLLWVNASTIRLLDYNAYQGAALSWRVNGTFYATLADWQSATGYEGHSRATNGSLGLDGSYRPGPGSFVSEAGVNLGSLGIAALNSDRVGAVRPSITPWTAGAHQVSTDTPLDPPAQITITRVQ